MFRQSFYERISAGPLFEPAEDLDGLLIRVLGGDAGSERLRVVTDRGDRPTGHCDHARMKYILIQKNESNMEPK